ncbi:MAG TPA: BlaI/MecI/CopY family transcriptional regulator [Pirellulales bacterium]|jgi:predicted transcriptional regulator
MTNPRPALSKGEMAVAHVLWTLGSATVRQVHAAFPAERPIDFTTVQTYLRRLEAKGYVRGRLQGRTRLYTAKVKPRTVIRDTIDELVERLFGGETLPLVRHLIEERGITGDDIAELRGLLDKLEHQRLQPEEE